VTGKDRWPRFKTKEAAQEIAARCHAMERQTMVHWRCIVLTALDFREFFNKRPSTAVQVGHNGLALRPKEGHAD
jgi:hypothetical protein